jgi:GNAT superfamily N-acetyltransferase
MSVEIVLTDTPPAGARDAILKPLLAYNSEQAGAHGSRTLALLIQDDSGAVIGGLWGRTAWTWLFVELLVVPESLRSSGMGTQLMRRAEDEARQRGCRNAWLDTYSFQARGFYEKLGYRVFGSLDGYPPGHQRFFLTKSLA